MKSFFKMMFATIVGIFVSMLLLFLVLLGIVSAIVASTDTPVEVMPNSILKLSLNNEIVERSDRNPLEGIEIGGFGKERRDGLKEIIESIQKAKIDANIKGIYLELAFIAARPATLEEIRNALLDFRKSGKFVISYADYMAQGAYYVATASDKIYMNPAGVLDFTGMRSEVMFFKGTLEKLGIEPQIIRHGKFKSAVEPFLSDKMSPENREQIGKMIGSIWNHALEGISTARNISTKQLNMLADRMVLANPDTCVVHHIIDGVLYKDQIDSLLVKRSGQSAGKPEYIGLSKYEKVPGSSDGKAFSKNKIAVIYAFGEVVMGDAGEGSIGSTRIADAISDARKDTSVKAIVLRVNSPGGSALASEIIWREVVLAKQAKPVVVSMGELAASGGYYIACAADTIVAQPNTITGSIGVFGLMFSGKQLLNQKLGITTDVVKTNAHSDFPSFSRTMDVEERAMMQLEIDNIYNTFVSHVAMGRHLSAARVDEIGQGRVWTGADAKNLGLVDTIGGLQVAIDIAARMAKLDTYRISYLPKLEDALDRILKDLSGDVKANFVKEELGEGYKYYQSYKNLLKQKGTLARMPFDVEVY